MPTFQYQGNTIEYTLTRNAKRNVNFRVKNNGEICISAPKRVSQAEINRMIQERAEWLIRNKQKAEQKKHNEIPQDIQNGTIVYLNGNKYHIQLISGKDNQIQFHENILQLTIKQKYITTQEYINTYFDSWLKDMMYYIGNRYIDTYLQALQKYHLSKPELLIRTMNSRWGSCTPTQCKITLNKNLIYPPHAGLQYVVLHELAHLVEANHSKRFYAIIAEVMPDWKERKKMLNEF